MTTRTFILSAFSMACLGVAILGYQSQERRAEALALASAATVQASDCMSDGFETAEGFVGCLQPASYVFAGEPPSRLQYFIDEVAYVFGL